MLPVSIITGFLGSGKTTLLNRLVQHESLRNSIVIINEFGEVGIDHLLVSAPEENMRLLSNGCLCCEVRGDLVETLTDISIKRQRGEIARYDRILIETTGLADPVPIVQTIVTDRELSDLFRLDKVVTVVDVVHAGAQLSAQDEARKQVALSDVIVFTKTDLAGPSVLADVKAAVSAINRGAAQFEGPHGAIDPDLLFTSSGPDGASRVADIERWLAEDRASQPGPQEQVAYKPHAGNIGTCTLYHDAPVTSTGLATWLSMVASYLGPELLRMKGIVNVSGDAYVVHAVQTVLHDPERLDRWPGEDRRTRVVFIGRDLDRERLKGTFAAFSMPEISSTGKLQIDSEAYACFVKAASQLVAPVA